MPRDHSRGRTGPCALGAREPVAPPRRGRMVNRDDNMRVPKRRLPADERVRSEPLADSDSSESTRRPRPPTRPQSRSGPLPGPSVSSTPWVPPTPTRRAPSHPAWEKPPTFDNYPRLRGRDDHRSVPAIWPLIMAVLGVALVLLVLIVIPALLGRGGGGVAAVSASPSTVASHPVGASPSAIAAPSKGVEAGSPTPVPSYRQYKIAVGDKLNLIAVKFKVTPAEILAINPQITNANLLKVGTYINIPPADAPTPSPAAPRTT